MRAGIEHRPPGFPRAGVPAFLCLYLLLGIVPALALTLLGYLLHSPDDQLLGNFVPYVAGVSALLLTTVIGLGRGELWDIKLFRAIAWLLIGFMIVDAAAAIAILVGAVGIQPGARTTAFFAIAVVVGCCLPAGILLRGMWFVRWLDVNALPHEWEAPMPRGRR